jgi:hypothetical protein
MMKAVLVEGIENYRSGSKPEGLSKVKCLIQKLVKTSLIDAEPFLNSKDWPYLWKK